MTPGQFARRLMGWLLLAGFSGIMFATLLYWWLSYHRILVLKGVIVAAGEPNGIILASELVMLPVITLWATVEAVLMIWAMARSK